MKQLLAIMKCTIGAGLEEQDKKGQRGREEY
jgi:hypothetical protein